MARIAFSGLFDRHPGLRILTHHGGGTVPHLEGRIAGGWDQLGARTPADEHDDVANDLKRRPLDYFKMFYADTALFGAPNAIATALAFFGPERGPGYIRTTISDLESLNLPDETRDQIYAGNAQRLLNLETTLTR